jgi:hypothetical protein
MSAMRGDVEYARRGGEPSDECEVEGSIATCRDVRIRRTASRKRLEGDRK